VVEKIDPYVTHLSTKSSGESSAYIAEAAGLNRRADVSAPRIEIQQAGGGMAASELRLEPGTSYVSRHQERFIDGKPWSLQTTYYPMQLVEKGANELILAQDFHDGAVRYIETVLGIRQIGWRDRITVRPPDQNETAFFKLPDDGHIAVFEIIRTSFEESGQPLRVTITTYPADRNEFVVIAGDLPVQEQPNVWHSGNPANGTA
jgi:GntR family transcriptional regulator